MWERIQYLVISSFSCLFTHGHVEACLVPVMDCIQEVTVYLFSYPKFEVQNFYIM
jgi:hypothetical protein